MELEETTELTHEETTEALINSWGAHEKLLDMIESAWGIIANAYGGEWDKAQNKDWHPAAIRWRETYHELLGTLPTPSDQVEEETNVFRGELRFVGEDPMLERLADEVHQLWCIFMEHLFKQGSSILGNESWIMNKSAKRRWTRQMITPYAQLSEDEKKTDREIARRYLDITLLKEIEDELR